MQSRVSVALRRVFVIAAVSASACSPDPGPTAPGVPASGAGTEATTASAVGRPNVVVIMSDDQTVEEMRVMPQTRSLIGSDLKFEATAADAG